MRALLDQPTPLPQPGTGYRPHYVVRLTHRDPTQVGQHIHGPFARRFACDPSTRPVPALFGDPNAGPASLWRLRALYAQGNLVATSGDITRHGHTRTVYLIADARRACEFLAGLAAWAQELVPPSVLPTEFPQHLDDTHTGIDCRASTSAWWDIAHHVLFTLDAEVARSLLEGVRV